MLGQRKKQILIGVGLVLVVATLWGRMVFRDSEDDREAAAQDAARARAGQAWANLWHCTLGGSAPDAELPARARRIAQAKTEASPWPESCSEFATKVYSNLTEITHPALRAALRERFACDTVCRVHDPGRQMVNLAPLGTDLPDVAPNVPAPPMAPPPAMTKTSLKVLAPADAEVVRRDVDARRLELRSPTQGRFACEVDVDGGDVRCVAVAAEVPPDAELVADSDRLLLVDGKKTYAPDGSAVKTHVGRVEGHTLFLQGKREDDRRWEVAQVKAGSTTRAVRIELPESSPPFVIDDQVAWVSEKGQLLRRPITASGDLLGKSDVVGSLPSELRRPPRRCPMSEGHALVFGLPPTVAVTWTSRDGGMATPVTFAASRQPPPREPAPERAATPEAAAAKDFGMAGLLESSGVEDPPWGAPSPAESSPLYARKDGMRTRSARAHRASSRPHRGRVALGCDANHASIHWRQPRVGSTELHRILCTRQTCEEEVTTLDDVDPQSWWWVGPVGQRAIAVWRDPDGLLRLRHGDFASLAAVPSQTLLDGEKHGGPRTLGVEVFPGRSAVVFWFRSAEGSHALRIDEAGTVTSLGP